ncbi:MAG: efflux RND transporter periplasmic adaptor subunit [Gammaproteobacteria bacterium]|nr:efflux RND transporter periplasmic adaptor subunit [Gammaproteobacteria bacterium]
MLWRLIGTVLAIGLVIGGVVLFKQNQQAGRAAAMADGPPPATVTATQVESTPWTRRIEASGTLTAIQDVHLASEVPGKVIAIEFRSGASVQTGDVLLRLDAAEDRAQLESLQSDLRLARLENERILGLKGSAAFSRSQLDRTQAQVASLQALVERQQVILDRKVVRAPFAGTLGIRRVSLGDFVAPGDPLVRLQSLNPIHVDFTVPERHRAAVAPGQSLEVSVAAWPEATFSGEVLAISPDVDVRSRTLMLRGLLTNEDLRLQPGMFATVHLLVGAAEPVRTLPRIAIAFFAYGESVFVIDETDQGLVVHRQPVEVGRTREGRVEILSGLEVGQRVVHTGHLKLREGQTVKIVEGVNLPQGVGDR